MDQSIWRSYHLPHTSLVYLVTRSDEGMCTTGLYKVSSSINGPMYLALGSPPSQHGVQIDQILISATSEDVLDAISAGHLPRLKDN